MIDLPLEFYAEVTGLPEEQRVRPADAEMMVSDSAYVLRVHSLPSELALLCETLNAVDSRLAILDDVGHYPMLEAPDRWSDALISLLGASATPAA